MTAPRLFGKQDGTALVLYKGYPTAKRSSEDVWEVVYKYWCQLHKAEGLIPASFASCPHPYHTDLVLLETDIAENGIPHMCDVTLTYGAKNQVSISMHSAGDEQQSSVASWQEVPLDDDRLVSSGVLSSGQVASLRKKGYHTFSVGSVEYTYTDWATSFTWSEANLISGIGATSAPTGLTSATAGNWMKVGLTVRTDGDKIEKAATWRYSALGWKP